MEHKYVRQTWNYEMLTDYSRIDVSQMIITINLILTLMLKYSIISNDTVKTKYEGFLISIV